MVVVVVVPSTAGCLCSGGASLPVVVPAWCFAVAAF